MAATHPREPIPHAWGPFVVVLKVRCPVSRLPTSVGNFRSQLETVTAAVKDPHTWGIVLHRYAQARINFEAPHPRGDCSEESLLVALPVVTTPPHVGIARIARA